MTNEKRFFSEEEIMCELYDRAVHGSPVGLQFANAFAEFLKELIPVDAVEVVHGRWIHKNTCGPNTGAFHCSVCDKTPRSLCPEKFCPNCGATMDAKENDNG